MMNLGSEGVYLDEKKRTNPSRYLPGPKTPVKKSKISMLGSRVFWDLRSRPYPRTPEIPKSDFFNSFTEVLGPGRYLDGFVPPFSSRYTPSDPKFIILDPQNIKF